MADHLEKDKSHGLGSDKSHGPIRSPGATCANSLPTAHLERCQEPRHVVDTSAVIHLISLAADVQGRILDLSLGGCRIRTDRRFPVGIFRRVEVVFCIDGLPFRLGGVTQAIYDPVNVGIRFLDLSDRKREQLQQLIEEIERSEEQRSG